ncbi:MAG: maleylacetate reductase [Noviherbaspirillum sp.]
MENFVHQQLAARVVFGQGSFETLAAEVALLGASRALVLTTPEQADLGKSAVQLLGKLSAGLYTGARMHVPVATATEAHALAMQVKADCLIAVGGGSTTGLAKAMALQAKLPIVAVPTTYAGSEVTPLYGITQAGEKVTGKDARVLPKTVIYDINLSLSLPLDASVASGVNAIAHAAESLYARLVSPVTSLMAEEGIRAIVNGLRKLIGNPRDVDARSHCQYGAWLCGVVLGTTEMGLHHKLCHTLGGLFGLPHAQMHTVILPHALAYNAPAAPAAMARIARALGAGPDPAAALPALRDFLYTVNADVALADLGMKERDLDRAAAAATAKPYPNPRPFDAGSVRKLLDNAYFGRFAGQ